MKTTTKFCDECKYAEFHKVLIGRVSLECHKGHRPRFFIPKSSLDHFYGWKRKCDDFESKVNINKLK